MTPPTLLRRVRRGSCLMLAAVAIATPALAQTAPPAKPSQPARPAPRPAAAQGPPMFSFQAFGDVGMTGFAAKSSFDALFGSSSGSVLGGGVQVAHRTGFFLRFDLSRFSAEGERAFVYQGEVFKLGIPLNLTLTPAEFTVGYRFVARRKVPRPPAPPRPATPRKFVAYDGQARPAAAQPAQAQRPLRRWVPYVGGGIGKMEYEERSPLATGGELESSSFSSYHVLGGVDVPIWKFVGLGAEAHYRWVPDALGEDGVSKEFDEKDLGGYTFRLRLTLGR